MSSLTKISQEFCSQLGLNLEEENFIDTPKRFAEAYETMCRFYTKEAQEELKKLLNVVFKTNYKGMIIQQPIRIYSLCSHHLLPVTYDIVFGYIVNEKSLGFSKSVKALEIMAARPVSQEDFTQEAADLFQQALNPLGLMIVVKGEHSCMKIRSAKTNAINITSVIKGEFEKNESVKNEFLNLTKLKIEE